MNGAGEGLSAVNEAIVAAAKKARRNPEDVRLMAVAKTFGEADILPVLEAGHRLFGENRVQEAQSKWPALKARFPDVELHLIGPLQSNKVKDAVGLFDGIHTIDREKIALGVAREIERKGNGPKLFVQVNTGEEPQKGGVRPRDVERFLRFCGEEAGLTIVGLMCIPPLEEEAAVHFALLEKLAREAGLVQLSMGMSGDFEAAIAFGATYVRVGSAIFGERQARQ